MIKRLKFKLLHYVSQLMINEKPFPRLGQKVCDKCQKNMNERKKC